MKRLVTGSLVLLLAACGPSGNQDVLPSGTGWRVIAESTPPADSPALGVATDPASLDRLQSDFGIITPQDVAFDREWVVAFVVGGTSLCPPNVRDLRIDADQIRVNLITVEPGFDCGEDRVIKAHTFAVQRVAVPEVVNIVAGPDGGRPPHDLLVDLGEG